MVCSAWCVRNETRYLRSHGWSVAHRYNIVPRIIGTNRIEAMRRDVFGQGYTGSAAEASPLQPFYPLQYVLCVHPICVLYCMCEYAITFERVLGLSFSLSLGTQNTNGIRKRNRCVFVSAPCINVSRWKTRKTQRHWSTGRQERQSGGKVSGQVITFSRQSYLPRIICVRTSTYRARSYFVR